MKHRSTTAARFALNGVALAAACLWGSQVFALGLGRQTVTSALGETLRAEIEVTSITPDEASSLRLRVATPDAYRAAGVEYNSALATAQVQLVRRPDGRQVLRVTSDRAVLEPFVDVIVEATWASGRLVREYTMLFDPPNMRTAQAPAPATAPAMTPAPAQPSPAAPAPMAPPPLAAAPPPAPRPAAPPRQPAAAMETPRPPVASAAPADGADEYRVRAGDSLSRIAGRLQRPGVSLDQMLVSLYRGNPQAFVGDNMNRLKAGVVLQMPSADQATKLSQPEAREVILAQSNDFAAYRQRLAAGTTTAADTSPARQARGQVQAQVDDRKTAAAPTPDRLTLSQGGVRASAPDVRASAEAQRKDERTRVAELNRNVDELRKLQQGAATAPKAPVAPAPAPAPAAAPTPPAVTAPAPTVVAALPPPPAALTPAPAPVPAPGPATAPATAPITPAPAPTPAPKPPPATPAAAEPGMMDSLLDNSLLLPFAGVLVALLAGLGLYRLRGRMRKPAGETSFLESRLQPDSFFGASGGQRIDTRDAGSSSNSSSMSYSLSQLDAIGDVDPVAEADVYLAYGRDLQAEEILKEAMRAAPERMAIRSKLLEVYAKRRDTKAFELLATQLFNLTRGEGEDWSKAQVMGMGIDPDNVLYQPGGEPEEVRGAGGQVVAEPLGASTVPYTAPVGPPQFQPAADATLDSSLDLDLELEGPGPKTVNVRPPPAPPSAFQPTEMTMPFSTGAQIGSDATLDFSLDGEVPKTIPLKRNTPQPQPQPPMNDSTALDFDLEALDTQPPTVTVDTRQRPEPALDFGEFSIGGQPLEPMTVADGDPLARKLELAEEFRQIGDLEGARDLLEEVLTKGNGALQAKAQGMLDKLG